MFNPGINDPGPWQWFVKRRDNIGLPLMEVRRKYLKEQLAYDNHISRLNSINWLQGASGGPAPSTGGGGGSGYDIEFKINTNYSHTSILGTANPTTRLNLNFSATAISAANNFGPDAANWVNGNVTVDWGDGTVEEKTAYDTTFAGGDPLGVIQHDYATDGEYTVKVKGPGAYYLKFLYTPLVDILTYDPSLTEDWAYLFSYITKNAMDNFVGDISNWTIPSGTSLACLASMNPSSTDRSECAFTLDVSDWDVSGVTSLRHAFSRQYYMNGTQFDNWAPSSTLTDLNNTFYYSTSDFSGNNDMSTLDFTNWDTSGVTDWTRFLALSNYNGLGFSNLDFSSLADTGENLIFAKQPKVKLPAGRGNIGAWNVPGGDASVTGILFPGFGTAMFGSGNWFAENTMDPSTLFPFTKADFGDTIVGWANNANMTTNSQMNVSWATSDDFDYSGDATVAAALTTLQNDKGWTLTGFTF